MKTKVVLHNSEHDELELGVFSQGVVIEDGNTHRRRAVMKDVASGNEIAIQTAIGWRPPGAFTLARSSSYYHSCFIHGVPVGEPAYTGT